MSEKSIVRTGKAPEPIGPYSQAIVAGVLVWCSGQIGVDPKTGALAEGAAAQTERAIENLKAVLEEAGSGLDNVVKTTLYLKNISDFAAVNEVYARHFAESKPARTTVEVSAMPKGALVELDAVAVL